MADHLPPVSRSVYFREYNLGHCGYCTWMSQMTLVYFQSSELLKLFAIRHHRQFVLTTVVSTECGGQNGQLDMSF